VPIPGAGVPRRIGPFRRLVAQLSNPITVLVVLAHHFAPFRLATVICFPLIVYV